MNGRGWRVLVGAWCLIVVGLFACGGETSTSDNAVESSVADAGEDAGQSSGGVDDGADSGGEADVGGLRVPLAPSADAVATTESGPLTVVQFIVPIEQQEATIAFYDGWVASQPDEYLRTEAGSGGVSWQNNPEAGSDKQIISVLSPLDGDDFVTVTLAVGPPE